MRSFALLFIMCSVGCSSQKVVPVSGRVTLDSKPIANAIVLFSPVAESAEKGPGPGSQGKTDAEGKFSLKLMSGTETGAVPGKHKVTITVYEGDEGPGDSGNPKSRKIVAKMEQQFEVPAAGTTAANFEMTGSKK